MNNEFTKIKNKTETRYVLETASAGGTSAGAIASVSSSVGGVRKRSDNILAQETDGTQKAGPSRPRNFVAKNAKAGGAGAHRDKKKEQKQGKEKHKKAFAEDSSHSLLDKLVKISKQAAQEAVMADSIHKRQLARIMVNRMTQAIKMLKGGTEPSEVIQFIKGPNDVSETAPKGWEGTVKAMKKHKDIDNPYALTNWMKNKGYQSHKESDDSSTANKGIKVVTGKSDYVYKQVNDLVSRGFKVEKTHEHPNGNVTVRLSYEKVLEDQYTNLLFNRLNEQLKK